MEKIYFEEEAHIIGALELVVTKQSLILYNRLTFEEEADA